MGKLMAFFPSSWRSLTVKRKRKGKTGEYRRTSVVSHVGSENKEKSTLIFKAFNKHS